jgi:hypothetical protein
LDAGKKYNFLAQLTASNLDENALQPIKFSVNQVSDWEDGGSVTVPTPSTK